MKKKGFDKEGYSIYTCIEMHIYKVLQRLRFYRVCSGAVVLFLAVSLFAAAVLLSCATAQPLVEEPLPEPPAAEVDDPAPEELVPEEVPEPEAADPQEEPEEAEQEEPPQAYEMSDEVYQETKRNLGELVQELNKIISAKDYETWLSYLTREYIDYYSQPSVLQEQSESPLLKKYNVVLRSLRDYFHYVVVGSRQNVRLDEIKAMEEGRVRAYMYINEDPVIIYELQKVNDEWKIGVIN